MGKEDVQVLEQVEDGLEGALAREAEQARSENAQAASSRSAERPWREILQLYQRPRQSMNGRADVRKLSSLKELERWISFVTRSAMRYL